MGYTDGESGALHFQSRQAKPAENQGRTQQQVDQIDRHVDLHGGACFTDGAKDADRDKVRDQQRRKQRHGAQIGHAGLAGETGAALLNEFENMNRARVPDQGEHQRHDDAHHHGLTENVIRLVKVAGPQLPVDDQAGADHKRQQDGKEHQYDLNGQSHTCKGRSAQTADKNRFDGPHDGLRSQIDNGGKRRFQYGGYV